jgi:uncharacterized protein
MRFLIRLMATKVPNESLLEGVRTIAKTLGVDPRNPKRTSYGALELDIFSSSRADFDLFLEAVRPVAEIEFIRDLNVAPQHKEEAAVFSEARELFNGERYWECHEVLEGVWRTKHGDEKRLLQGIILVCAAFVHHQKGEDTIALGVLRRGIKQLEYPTPAYGGFSVSRLKRDVEEVLESKRFWNFPV